jgi:predicted HicB family RNase H-like nuclease
MTPIVTISVRIPLSLKDAAVSAAEESHRTLHNWIIHLIRQELEK